MENRLDDAEHWVIHRDPPRFEEQKSGRGNS